MTRTYHFSVRRRASVVYPMLIFETWVGYNAASNTAGTSVAAKGDYVTITGAEFGLQFRKGPHGHCTVGYNAAKQEVFFNPATGPNRIVQALAPRDKMVQLHILVDRSVVDIFGNNGVTWNCEFFNADPKSLGIELYAKSGTVQLLSLDLWKLKS